jgi:hypothetical protein
MGAAARMKSPLSSDLEILVPFGIDRWSARDLRARLGASGSASEPPFPFVVVARGGGDPLRLYHGAGALFSQRTPTSIDDPLAAIREQLNSLSNPWNRPAHDFVDAYFAAIEEIIAGDTGAILAQSIGGKALYRARDWIYSAPSPLPRAHVPAPAQALGPDAPADETVKVDFAFWSGRQFVAVDFGRSRLLPRARRYRDERLGSAHVELVETTPRDQAAWAEFLGRLGPSQAPFWTGETIPMGPFPSSALDALDEMVAAEKAG